MTILRAGLVSWLSLMCPMRRVCSFRQPPRPRQATRAVVDDVCSQGRAIWPSVVEGGVRTCSENSGGWGIKGGNRLGSARS